MALIVSNYLNGLARYLVWLSLGGGMIVGCGPGLLQQVQLRALADQAISDCVAAGKPCPNMVAGQTSACQLARSKCQAALACTKAIQGAEVDIQTLQKARAGSGATADQIALATGSEASARSYCQSGGWR